MIRDLFLTIKMTPSTAWTLAGAAAGAAAEAAVEAARVAATVSALVVASATDAEKTDSKANDVTAREVHVGRRTKNVTNHKAPA